MKNDMDLAEWRQSEETCSYEGSNTHEPVPQFTVSQVRAFTKLKVKGSPSGSVTCGPMLKESEYVLPAQIFPKKKLEVVQ
jgi:hypothetical protein